MDITTHYELDGSDRVSEVTLENNEGSQVVLLHHSHGGYAVVSKLESDTEWQLGGGSSLTSLATGLLQAHVLLGLIPPHNFDEISCPYQH